MGWPPPGTLPERGRDRFGEKSGMIVRPMNGETRLITQHDHARVAGTLARHWKGNEIVPAPEPSLKDAVLFAIDNHDVGWCGPDASSRYDPETRTSMSFFGSTAEEAIAIWEEGVDRCGEYRAFSGFMVSCHFSRLAETGLRGAPSEELNLLRGFIQTQEKKKFVFVRNFSPAENDSKEDSALLLGTCDTLSLLICGAPEISPSKGATRQFPASGLQIRILSDEVLGFAPWPFDVDRLEVKYPGVVIPGGPFAGVEAWEAALEMAEPNIFTGSIMPLDLEK